MTNPSHDQKARQRWEPTKYQNIFRYVPSGTLYARFKVRGKPVRVSLKTSDPDLARTRLSERLHQEHALADRRFKGRMSFGEALEGYTKRVQRNPLTKPRTKAYFEQEVVALKKTWPGLEELDVRAIRREDCEEWASRFAKQYSASAYNHTISIIKHIFEVAMENGALFTSPAAKLKRRRERPKSLTLPTQEQFEALLAAMERSGSGWSKPCADLVRFLAYGGLRKGEAAGVTWADVDFTKGQIRVLGDRETGTKNGEWRLVPMIAEMRALLQPMRAARADEPGTSPVMEVRECQRALDRACAVTKMVRITHHDLRHFFATRCIENGVDIPTVSRWLGHKDGGALAMRVYGHLRDEHSRAMAAKVSFGAATTPPTKPKVITSKRAKKAKAQPSNVVKLVMGG